MSEINMSFEEYMGQSYSLLTQLFGVNEIESKRSRLEKIFYVSEDAWRRNLHRLKNLEIKYLLIGEAPPWSPENRVFYFYETFDESTSGRPIQWIRAVWDSLIDHSTTSRTEENLKLLSKSGFLLVDSLPFAMKYSTEIRKTPQYKEIIRSCAYLQRKIETPKLRWAKDVKVAIAFKYNGIAIIEGFPDGITLPNGATIDLQNTIATSGSGFPTKDTLLQKWGL